MYILKEYHNGCATRKCPCRMWVNCKTYIDVEKQQNRLKKKDLIEYYEPITIWYKDNFKASIETDGSIGNG